MAYFHQVQAKYWNIASLFGRQICQLQLLATNTARPWSGSEAVENYLLYVENCCSEARNLANQPAKSGKICWQKTVVPRHHVIEPMLRLHTHWHEYHLSTPHPSALRPPSLELALTPLVLAASVNCRDADSFVHSYLTHLYIYKFCVKFFTLCIYFAWYVTAVPKDWYLWIFR